MKYLILVGDGMGDEPLEELGGRTPLEAAEIPFIDQLCAKGELFLNRTIPPGYPPGSDVANLSLLGYDPAQHYTGRAPFEAAAMGLIPAADETAFRCNMVTLEFSDNGRVKMIDFTADHISTREAAELITSLNQECASEQFRFHNGVSYRHILMVKGDYPPMNPAPPHDHIGKDVTDYWQEYLGDPNWRQLLEKSRELLDNHPVNQIRIAQGKLPANSIWLWGEGKLPQVPSFYDTFGLSGSMISAVDLLKGLGVATGLTVVNVDGATGYLDTNYKGKAMAALNVLSTQDFVFVHVEAPDEAGHQGLIKEKIIAIEDFDQKIVQPIIEGLRERDETFRVVVTMDHMTPICLRTHTSDPVPTILYDSRESDAGCGKTFSENECRAEMKENGYEIRTGHYLMNNLLEMK